MAKILVIDDDTEAAYELAVLFRNMGHVAQAAFDGRQGLEVFLLFEPDIVLLDLDIPLLDGYHVAQAIRTQAPTGSTYLLALTAARGQHVEVATKAVGFDAYMRKPPDMVALLAIVADVVSRRP